MKVALKSTMHFEMSHREKMQKALWNACFRIGTRGAVSPVGRNPTEAGSSNETDIADEDAALVCDQSARQTSRSLQAASLPLSLRALQVVDGRRGALRPIPENGTPLSRDEVVARAATFASGPCPAMRRVTEVRLHANGASGHVPAHAEESRDFDLGSH
jgi:hypothetical protein